MKGASAQDSTVYNELQIQVPNYHVLVLQLSRPAGKYIETPELLSIARDLW